MAIDQEWRNRMADKSGDNNAPKFPKYMVPIIAFNGNTGEFRLRGVDGDKYSKEETPIDKPVELVILKKRSAFATKLGANPELFSSEFGSPLEKIALFTNMGRVSFEMSGTAAEIRAKYPEIKTKSILYCLYEGAVHKLEVKGASLTNLFVWQNSMREKDKHSFEVVTVVDAVKEKHETSKKTYFAMTFTDKPLTNTDGIEEAMDEVNAAIKKLEEYQASRNAAPSPVTTVIKSATDAEFDALGAGEVNPDDIPF